MCNRSKDYVKDTSLRETTVYSPLKQLFPPAQVQKFQSKLGPVAVKEYLFSNFSLVQRCGRHFKATF